MEETGDENLLQKLRDNYEDHDIFLRDKGKEVLNKALRKHFTAAHPHDHSLVDQLVKVNQSRYHLGKAFQKLYEKNLINIYKVRDDEGIVIDKRGTGYSLQNYAIIFGIIGLENDDDGKYLMKSMEGMKEKVTIKKAYRVKWGALKKIYGLSRHNLALQVAGLMYVADPSTFWEKFKPYMRFVSSDTILDARKKSDEFEEERGIDIEAVPCFSGCLMSTTIEETCDEMEGMSTTIEETCDDIEGQLRKEPPTVE